MDNFDALRDQLEGRYQLQRQIGAGGMATVYLAQDVRHARSVAIKVLRSELSAVLGATRFLAEIRTTANLQHPHILSLYDSGEAAGTVFYVMPFVDGESLRDRLTREKQLPVEDALRIARDVGSALDYAHRHGIVHRDIKPENILLNDGQALVADFGIALAASAVGGDRRMTQTGMSLGTPHYMAPEQAMGEREITAKADLYALGCVLYEMLVGEPPFTGPTAQAIVARVMTEEPRSLVAQRRTVPPAVEDIVRRSLQKLPADRYASAAQFVDALAKVGTEDSRGFEAVRYAAQAGPRLRTTIGIAAVVVAATWGAAAWWYSTRTPGVVGSPPSRLAVFAPGLGGKGDAMILRHIALTPDGAAVLYLAAGEDGINRLMHRPLESADAVPIPGAQGGLASPAVSPNGHWIVGTVEGKGAFRYPMDGGTAVHIPDPVLNSSFAAWAPDGSLWMESGNVTSSGAILLRIDTVGAVHTPFPNKLQDMQIQQILPDGRSALALRKVTGTISGPVFSLDLTTGELAPIGGSPAIEARFTDGFLVSVLPDGTMQATPFDPVRRATTGASVAIASSVSLTGTGIAQFGVAPNGTVAYIVEEPRSLVLMDRSGVSRPAVSERSNYHAPTFSPDGRRVATDRNTNDGRDVWIIVPADKSMARATYDRDGHDATWTPDGAFLTYASTKSGVFGIYKVRPGTAEPAESLVASPRLSYTGTWLRDGSGLVTTGNALHAGSLTDIAFVGNAGRGPIEPIVATRFEEQYPAISRDGRWLAYVSDNSGQQEVYIRPLRGDAQPIRVSQTGGIEPVWSADGRALFYRATVDSRMVLVMASVQTSPTLAVTARRPLFDMNEIVGSGGIHANYDVSPDGRSFVMVQRSAATRIMVIQNLRGLVAKLKGPGGAR